MTKAYRTKTFKSGNSVAIRVPKALGLVDGDEVVIAPHADGRFTFWKEGEELRVLMGLYGAFSPGFMSEGRGDTDQQDYQWAEPPARDEAA